ncbi:MAG: Carnitine transport ATP-binding protein OpuCA [Anaerolineae bacterium]|nr:Carnitine transport ATP-binding protein OpuCA [Anaerolineae bacterium]
MAQPSIRPIIANWLQPLVSRLAFQHVSKTFPSASHAAVHDCTFEVAAASFVVLLGPSGCGKTTLLKMVNRLLEPSAGEIFLDGKNIHAMDATALRRQIGYVIQQVGLFPHLTVAQNIAVVPELLGWTKARIAARTDELLELVKLDPEQYRARYPAQLSGGQQQRVGLARALAADPQLLLMDEPFGAIDAITRASLQDEMLRLKNAISKTILFVTHDVEEALRLADKIVVLRAGEVVQYDTPHALLTQPANEFVRALIGADDTMRQLALVRVAEVMQPFTHAVELDNALTLSADDNLRVALSKFLASGATTLTVVQDQTPVGIIRFDQIRALSKHAPS